MKMKSVIKIITNQPTVKIKNNTYITNLVIFSENLYVVTRANTGGHLLFIMVVLR